MRTPSSFNWEPVIDVLANDDPGEAEPEQPMMFNTRWHLGWKVSYRIHQPEEDSGSRVVRRLATKGERMEEALMLLPPSRRHLRGPEVAERVLEAARRRSLHQTEWNKRARTFDPMAAAAGGAAPAAGAAGHGVPAPAVADGAPDPAVLDLFFDAE
jgi:hypothetical protein